MSFPIFPPSAPRVCTGPFSPLFCPPPPPPPFSPPLLSPPPPPPFFPLSPASPPPRPLPLIPPLPHPPPLPLPFVFPPFSYPPSSVPFPLPSFFLFLPHPPPPRSPLPPPFPLPPLCFPPPTPGRADASPLAPSRGSHRGPQRAGRDCLLPPSTTTTTKQKTRTNPQTLRGDGNKEIGEIIPLRWNPRAGRERVLLFPRKPCTGRTESELHH